MTPVGSPGYWDAFFSGVSAIAQDVTPNQALEPTPNNLRSCLAPALGRGSPRAFGVNSSEYGRDTTVAEAASMIA